MVNKILFCNYDISWSLSTGGLFYNSFPFLLLSSLPLALFVYSDFSPFGRIQNIRLAWEDDKDAKDVSNLVKISWCASIDPFSIGNLLKEKKEKNT